MASNLERAEVGELTGTAYYTSVHSPQPKNKDFDTPPQFVLNLIPDAKSKKIIEGYGHTLQTPKDTSKVPGAFIKISNKIYSEPGTDEYEEEVEKKTPSCVDSKLNTIPSSVLIGNGSKVKVKVGWAYVKQQKKRYPRFWGLQVLDLVPYERTDTFKAEKNGFEVNNHKTTTTNNEDPNDDI